VNQLKWDFKAFSTQFPGPILHVKSEEIHRWLRGLGFAVSSRNNLLLLNNPTSVRGWRRSEFARLRKVNNPS